MGLLQQWRDTAYSQQTDKKVLQKFWTDYFMIEKGIYEKLLSEPDVKVKGTVKELAAKYEIPVMTMVGFLDGIDESLIVPNPIEEMDEDTEVNLIFDKEKLYKNMVDAKADCTVCRCGTISLTKIKRKHFTVKQRKQIRLSKAKK